MKKRRSKSKHLRKFHIKPVWVVVLFSFILILGGIFGYIHERAARQAKRAIESQKFSANLTYKKSLDLRVAERAVFDSPALHTIETLPTNGGIKKLHVQFNVDGLNQFALITLPDKPTPNGGFPVIVLLHGYVKPTAYSTKTAYVGDMEFLSRNGFAVVKPDFRGNGQSEGLAEGAYYSMGYHNDIMTLLSAIKKTNYLNGQQFNLWGHSMGGYLALRTAVMRSDIANIIILSGAVGSAEKMFTTYTAPSDKLNLVAREYRFEALRIHGNPLKNPEFWFNASPYSRISKISANVQIHVGLKDEVVPPQFSSELATALAEAGITYQLFTYEEGKHGLIPQRRQINDQILKLLLKQ